MNGVFIRSLLALVALFSVSAITAMTPLSSSEQFKKFMAISKSPEASQLLIERKLPLYFTTKERFPEIAQEALTIAGEVVSLLTKNEVTEVMKAADTNSELNAQLLDKVQSNLDSVRIRYAILSLKYGQGKYANEFVDTMFDFIHNYKLHVRRSTLLSSSKKVCP